MKIVAVPVFPCHCEDSGGQTEEALGTGWHTVNPERMGVITTIDQGWQVDGTHAAVGCMYRAKL